MILKTAWFKIDPLPPKEFEHLCQRIADDQFTEDTFTGFIIDSRRKSSIEARYIQKRVITETFLDPFGNESQATRTNYIQTRFTLQKKTPQLVVINPPRTIAGFITRIGEHCPSKTAIYPPENETKNLIQALSVRSVNIKTTGILISDIQLKGPAVAKVLIQGTGDITEGIQEMIRQRRHSVKESQLEVTTAEGVSMKITVKEASRFSIQTEHEEIAMNFLRQVLEGVHG